MMKYSKYFLVILLAAIATGTFAAKKKKTWPTDKAYITKRTATIQAMDSVLKLSGYNPDPLMRYADMKCKEFDYDPELMRGIASGFATHAGYIKESSMRYQEIKRLYPDDFESYSSYAATLFDHSIKVNPDGGLTRDTAELNLAKAQIDSAKVALPGSKAPYRWWLARCTRYAYNDALIQSFRDEVEAYRKAFPDDNADFVAANYLGDAKIEMNMANFNTLYDEERQLQDYLRADAEEYRRREAQKYFDKIDINTLPLDNLYQLTVFYYQSTESRFMGRDGRALLHEKGLEQASLGTEKFPEEKNFNRLQLWHAAELAKIHNYRSNQAKKDKDTDLQTRETANRDTMAAQGIVGAEKLMSKTDTLLRQDYYFAGVVNQFKKQYEKAIDNYKKAMGPIRFLEAKLPWKAPYHNCDSVTIYENIADCYSALNQHENAIAQYTTLYEHRSRHGQPTGIQNVANLATLYRAMGNDTTKTQPDRFAAFVAADSLYALIQDSIDAGSENFPSTKGYAAFYTFQRYTLRNHRRVGMNSLSDYAQRENYLAIELADDIINRIDPLEEKSDRELSYIANVSANMWLKYYNSKDYRACLPYQKLIAKYDTETATTYKKQFEFAVKKAKTQPK